MALQKSINMRNKVHFFLQNYIFQWKATPFQSKRYCNLIRNELSVKKIAPYSYTHKKKIRSSFSELREIH